MKRRVRQPAPKIAALKGVSRDGNEVNALREVVEQQAKRILALRMMLRMANLPKPRLPSAQLRADVGRYRQDSKRNPDDHRTRDWLAYSYMQLGKYKRATRLLRHLIKCRPQESWHQRNLGYCYEVLGKQRRAKAAYEAALALDENDGHNRFQLAYWYFGRRQYGRAEELFRQLIERSQSVDLAYCYLGHIFRHRKRYSEAFDSFALALSTNANCETAVHFMLALNHRHKLGHNLATTRPDLAGPITAPPATLGLPNFYEKCGTCQDK